MDKSLFRMGIYPFWMDKNFYIEFFLSNNVPKTSETKWMEKSPFRMEISPFWMEKISCGLWSFVLKKKGSKHFWTKMNGEISIQNGDFSILNGENYLWSLFFKKKKSSKHFNISGKKWMEKSPFWMEISPFWMEKIICIEFFFNQSSQKLLKENEWINLHSDWRFLHSEWIKLFVWSLFF